ncbi:hypothetical protein [Rhodococcus sp. NPDC058481]|uniref:hypothetical protein n=1 Tax=unclassified Rhodococcus (in: high G+C Gram-positive bacteria) TaxID=192944 RepID=UPI00364D2F9B
MTTTDATTAGFVELPADHDQPGPWFIPEDARTEYLTVTLTSAQLDAARLAVLDDVRQRAWIDDQHAELRRRTPGISDREVEQWTSPKPDRFAALALAERFPSLDADGERLAEHVARRHSAVERVRARQTNERRREADRCALCEQVRPGGLRQSTPFGTGPDVMVCRPCGQVLDHRVGVILADQLTSSGESVSDRADQWIRANLARISDPAAP